MAVTTQITNGAVTGNKSVANVESQSAEENSKTEKTSSKTQQTKDMFMKLLVAQMKYQNPLEPTDNTEYIKEMASFSEVEAIEDMSSSFEKMSGNSLVGSVATATDDNGVEHTGKVEYTFKKDGSTWVHIGDDDYSLDNVTGVQDSDYYTANTIKDTLQNELAKLPSASQLTKSDTESVYNIQKIYNSLTSYQQSFIPESMVKTIEALVSRADELTGKNSTSDTTADTTSASSTTTEASTAADTADDTSAAAEAAAVAETAETADDTESEETSDDSDDGTAAVDTDSDNA
ncbi:MAG: flagellar hook assembly protein FlgD [Candidatus Weimeria sp.]